MQKIILALLLLFFIDKGNAQFSQQLQLKSCSIDVKANPFTAVTFIELEIYNPGNTNAEAYQPLTFDENQVVTAFQLELNGKYRDGSIEEQWKANNAYNRIVGKRVDPAILNKYSPTGYTLNIFPVPAHGSRKVTITLLQKLKDDTNRLTYNLPLSFTGNTELVKININVNGYSNTPQSNAGIIESILFGNTGGNPSLQTSFKNIFLNKPLSFSLPLKNGSSYSCINSKGDFLLRVMPDINKDYDIKPQHITILWDVSKSGSSRNIRNEINFLSNFLLVNRIKQADFITFNHRVNDKMVFTFSGNNFYNLFEHIRSLKYSGATVYDNIDFSSYKTDGILFFSDGGSSYGSGLPKPGAVQVNCIYSGYSSNANVLNQVSGSSGGRVISLIYDGKTTWIDKLNTAENYLLKCVSSSSLKVNTALPAKLGNSILLSGNTRAGDIKLIYGNNTSLNKTETYSFSDAVNCDEKTYQQVRLLEEYDSLMKTDPSWDKLVIFGLTNKIVTTRTSYIVLERIEDYIKYNIAPPDELKEKCAEMNYVYRSEYKIKAVKEYNANDMLAPVVAAYNARIRSWDKNETLIDLSKPVVTGKETVSENEGINDSKSTAFISGSSAGVNAGGGSNSLSEVVVTSAFSTKRMARSQASSVQVVSSEQLNSFIQPDIGYALAGRVAGVQVRGQSSALLGRESEIRLRGVNNLTGYSRPLYVVNGTPIESVAEININDVEDVTVLQGPASAALFGADGANGAIVITTKKAKRGYSRPIWSTYKLSSAEDVEYLQEIRNAEPYDKLARYDKLEDENKNDISFYFDMAMYFHDQGYKQKAFDILMDAVEIGSNNPEHMYTAGYILEKWNNYDEAIKLYKSMLNKFNYYTVQTKRNLAFALLGNKNYQAALDVLYDALSDNVYYFDSHQKEMALADLNAIASVYKDKVNVSAINPNLLKPLPVDLRISVESNYYASSNVSIAEPDNSVCSYQKNITKNGGTLNNAGYGYNYYAKEYTIKNAIKGKYRISLDTYNYYGTGNWIRLVTYKNFQKGNQEIETELICLDNQYGKVEIAEVSW